MRKKIMSCILPKIFFLLQVIFPGVIKAQEDSVDQSGYNADNAYNSYDYSGNYSDYYQNQPYNHQYQSEGYQADGYQADGYQTNGYQGQGYDSQYPSNGYQNDGYQNQSYGYQNQPYANQYQYDNYQNGNGYYPYGYQYGSYNQPAAYTMIDYSYNYSYPASKREGSQSYIRFGSRFDKSSSFDFPSGISSYQGTSTGPGPNGGYPGAPRGIYPTNYVDTSIYPNTYMKTTTN